MSVRARKLSRCVVAICAALALAQTGCGRRALSAEIPASELLADIHANAAPLILDVRTPEEFARGHVPGALNINIDELAQRIDELSGHRADEVVVYCERGPRALKAADVLADADFSSVRHLEGDMSGWRAAGLPTDN
jgi:rhodanese-related sulfurtransferase